MNVDTEFAFELGRVGRRWRARLDERLRHTGLTQARWLALLHISRAGPLSQRELAERMSIEGPSLVRLLDNLESQDLITRRSCGEDRRVKRIHLTNEASPLLKEIDRISNGLRQELLAEIPNRELKTALKVLRSISDKLERL